MAVYFARMHGTAFAYELQQEPCLLPACSGPGLTAIGRDASIRAGMHQRLYGSCHEAIDDEEVLLDAELRVETFEVTGTVILDSMAKDQVLSARRRADRIGLHKAQPVEGAFQRGGCEEAAGDGKAAQVVESAWHDQVLGDHWRWEHDPPRGTR